MNILKEIMGELKNIKISSSWNEKFYSFHDWKPSPVNSTYSTEKPYRLLYDGIYNNNGNIMEFQVGIMSNQYDYYELFVEDFHSNSYCKYYTSFNEALKKFIKLTNIRKPIVYKDDDKGNAIQIDFRVKPYATVSKYEEV